MTDIFEFPKILHEETMGNGQKKVMTQEEPMLWRVTIWTEDAQDWDWEEYLERTNAKEVFDLVTHIDDLGKV